MNRPLQLVLQFLLTIFSLEYTGVDTFGYFGSMNPPRAVLISSFPSSTVSRAVSLATEAIACDKHSTSPCFRHLAPAS